MPAGGSSEYKPLYKTDDPHGIAAMILGLFLVPFSQVLLWKNERKAVTFARMISIARKACVSADKDQPTQDNDRKLVHISGTTNNQIDLCDRDFGVVAKDSYRLKRKVEMF